MREKVLARDIDLVYVITKEWVADIFTKALSVEKLCRFRGLLGVLELNLSLRRRVEISSLASHVTPG